MDDAWTPGKDGLKLLELRLGIEVVELRKNAALAGVSESRLGACVRNSAEQAFCGTFSSVLARPKITFDFRFIFV